MHLLKKESRIFISLEQVNQVDGLVYNSFSLLVSYMHDEHKSNYYNQLCL